MAEKAEVRHTLNEQQARQLATVTKTVPMMQAITPRWLVNFLQWVPVEAGTYRVNKVVPSRPGSRTIECSPDDDVDLPEIYVDYEEKPREYTLSAVTTVLDLQTRISDMYRSPHDQIKEQLRLIIEKVKERQESELINNTEYGLLNNVDESMKIKTRKGAPTPDDLDELIARVWKEPAFFLAHPAGHCRFRSRVHAPRRAAADGDDIRQPISDLARAAAGAFRQGGDQGRQDKHSFVADGGEEAGRGRVVPARDSGRSFAQPVGSLHGHQSQGDRFVPDLSVLLAGHPHRRCSRRSRRRQRGSIP